jgi:hypothetical protein
MALATIGGLLTSLFLTLIVVPVAYDVFGDLQEKFSRKRVTEGVQAQPATAMMEDRTG